MQQAWRRSGIDSSRAPNCPPESAPQPATSPDRPRTQLEPQLGSWLRSTATASVMPSTVVAASRCTLVVVPARPRYPPPQHLTVPAGVTAHTDDPPEASLAVGVGVGPGGPTGGAHAAARITATMIANPARTA